MEHMYNWQVYTKNKTQIYIFDQRLQHSGMQRFFNETKYRIQVFGEVLYNNRTIATFHWEHQKSVCKCLRVKRGFINKNVWKEIANND